MFGLAGKVRFLLLAIPALLVAPVFAASAPVEGGYPVMIEDQFGRRITIPSEPRRIVSCSPGSTEMLFALGLGHRVVGVTNWCDYPAEAREKAKIGDILPLNMERIAALRPDLVVAEELNGREAIATLSNLGLTVLALKPDSFADILGAIELLGRATGSGTPAQNLAARLREAMDRAGRRGAATREKGLKVFILLRGVQYWTAGPGSFLDEAVVLAGGINIAHDLGAPWSPMDPELILRRDPDVILTELDPVAIYANDIWREVAAIRKRQVYQCVGDEFYRPGPRLIEALAELADLLAGSR